MYNKKGFLLVSFLFYLVFFSIITFFIGNILTRLIIPSFISLKKNQSIIALHIASDFFVRDIRNIKKKLPIWKVISPDELIWENDTMSIGWRFCHNRLERREGMYHGNWKKAKKSIIATGILDAMFTVEKDKKDAMVGLKLTLTSTYAPKNPIFCYVSLKKALYE